MDQAKIRLGVVAVLVILAVTIQQSILVTASLNLPYREGDWFRYKVEARVGQDKCWVEVEIKILEIDAAKRRVHEKIEVVNSGGSSLACQYFLGSIKGSYENWEYLGTDHTLRNFLLDPSVSGRFDLGSGGVVVYDKGVLKEYKMSGTYMGTEYEVSIRLVDSSVLAYKPWLIWLIIAVVVVVVVIVIVVMITRLRRKTRAMPTEQYPQGLQPPQPPQSMAT